MAMKITTEFSIEYTEDVVCIPCAVLYNSGYLRSKGILKQVVKRVPTNKQREDLIMKLRKIRIVADLCPLGRKNCDTCRYSNGTVSNKVYCYYGDKDWLII